MAKLGRPSGYSPEILEKTIEYIEGGYKDHDQIIPSVAGLAVALGVGRQSLYDWSAKEENADFSYILGALNTHQESVLLNKGLSSEFNPTITKLVLGKHGYQEKAETPTEGVKELADALHNLANALPG